MAQRTYAETVDYLYGLLPDAQRHGLPSAKIDLTKTLRLLEGLGNPHHRLRVIHVAGTNGKGTVSHLLASFATASGLRTGLYTSPHYVDFRERIRVDGELVGKEWVIDFTAEHEDLIERVGASFFEFTVAMAFAYFAARETDVAVIEVGLGGRLDSTNVVTPESLLLAVITNIGLDHTEVLGHTHAAIAREKAGIIKLGCPVLIGEYDAETLAVFTEVAADRNAQCVLAEESVVVSRSDGDLHIKLLPIDTDAPASRTLEVAANLHGPFALRNVRTAVAAWRIVATELALPALPPSAALADVQRLSGYRGRFQVLAEQPLVVADAGHNPHAWSEVGEYVTRLAAGRPLLVVCGFVRGKDFPAFFASFPVDTSFFVGAPELPRAVPAMEVVATVREQVWLAMPYDSIAEAYTAALRAANPTDTLFVGGSTFVVGALFEHLGLVPA